MQAEIRNDKAPAKHERDDLKKIHGLRPVLEKRLNVPPANRELDRCGYCLLSGQLAEVSG